MLDELRNHIKIFLDEHPLGILCTNGSLGASAAPIWHYHEGLELICLLQRWSDALYQIEQNPEVQIIFLDSRSVNFRWLQMRGTAQPMDSNPDWRKLNQDRLPMSHLDGTSYTAIRVIPQRIDLFDESLGWGARETLEF